MEKRNIERLITDLKNLPKEKAPENLEEKLLSAIENLNNTSNSHSDKFSIFSFYKKIFNPVLAPALSLVLVTIIMVFTLSNKSFYQPDELKEIKTFIDEKPGTVTGTLGTSGSTKQPTPVKTDKENNKVIKTEKQIIELGRGIQLDNLESEYETSSPQYLKETGFPPRQSVFSSERRLNEGEIKDTGKIDTLKNKNLHKNK